MAISKDAQAVINNAGAGALEYIKGQGGYGGKLTSGEATRLLTGFSPTITPQQVYSSSNIQQASTNPAPVPNYSDPFALREYFLNTPDIVSARANAQQVQADLLRARQTGRSQQQAIQELPQALNVIRGEQAVAGQQAALTEQALAENQLAAQSAYDALRQEGLARYEIANTQREELKGLITATKGKAGISYADTYENALKKAAKWEKKENDKIKKEAEKDELKKLALAAGISTKGKSSKEIRKKLEKLAKKDRELNDAMNSLKLQSAKASLVGSRSGSGSAKQSSIASLLTRAANMTSGGAEWAKKNAPLFGLTESDISPYLVGNWGDGFRDSASKNVVTPTKEIGDWIYYSDGSRENKETGEVQVQVQE